MLFEKIMHSHPILTAGLVVLAVGLILYGIWRVRHKVRWLIYPLLLVLIVKLGIVGMHIDWLLQI